LDKTEQKPGVNSYRTVAVGPRDACSSSYRVKYFPAFADPRLTTDSFGSLLAHERSILKKKVLRLKTRMWRSFSDQRGYLGSPLFGRPASATLHESPRMVVPGTPTLNVNRFSESQVPQVHNASPFQPQVTPTPTAFGGGQSGGPSDGQRGGDASGSYFVSGPGSPQIGLNLQPAGDVLDMIGGQSRTTILGMDAYIRIL
jgi:hypothetical protein